MKTSLTAQSSGITWLHFSDIHAGMDGQSRLWPRFGTKFLEDLDYVLAKSGPVDLVIFSGDLTQRGMKDEFGIFDSVIGKILEKISSATGHRPPLITTPGNHDLVRPHALAPEALVLADYWNKKEIQEALWEDAGSPYRDCIGKAFSNYHDWQQRAIASGVHAKAHTTGIFPGDASYLVSTEHGTIGLACLNSSWLQLAGGDYFGKLHVDVNQLLRITDGDPDTWTRKNAVNLLVTHHPASWLGKGAGASWLNDINPSRRFDLHLYGHMHEPATVSTAYGGSQARRNAQAASLFGLETYGASIKRIQGYSACKIETEGQLRTLTSWPRTLVETTGGDMKLAPDTSQDIEEESSCFRITYALDPAQRSTENRPNAFLSRENLTAPSTFSLQKIQKHLPIEKAHLNVRRIEQETFVHAMKDKRIVWLASVWGMGEDGFLSSVKAKIAPDGGVYRLSLEGYRTRDAFFDELRGKVGATFQQIAESIADAGPSILILDDVDLNQSAGDTPDVQRDIEDLAATFSDFAQDCLLVIRSKRAPIQALYKHVELKALDEADLATYLKDSDLGSERYAKADSVSRLLRHTDGLPNRIDLALRDLEIVSLEDLAPSNLDLVPAGGSLVAAPPALVATVQELQESEDRREQRAFQLLLALSAFPQGEQLGRLKRFLGPHPFFPNHARELLQRSLIDTKTTGSSTGESDDSTKSLVVSKPVRDYVRENTTPEEDRQLDKLAIELYFGENWASGDLSKSPTAKRAKEALCDGYEIQNAITLIFRAVARALREGTKFEVDGAIRLAIAFIKILANGDHFRTAIVLCEDILSLLDGDDRFSDQIDFINCEYASSLRMSGRAADAIAAFKSIDLTKFSKSVQQQVELDRTLCHKGLKQTNEAREAAKRVIAIDGKSAAATQARSVLALQEPDKEERSKELERLLASAKRSKLNMVANNIRLDLATERKDDLEQRKKLLREVLSSAQDDFYTFARAIVGLANLPDAVDWLTEQEKAALVDAYYYLYNERLLKLFDSCHAALWRIFEQDGNRQNLLNLFRHSSFIWRLSGREQEELKYLRRLSSKVNDLVTVGISRADRDGAYLIVRISVVLEGDGASSQ